MSVLRTPPTGLDETFVDPATQQLVQLARAEGADFARERIRQGADVDDRGTDGVTPLLWALLHRDRELFAALLDAGADPTVAVDSGMTTVHVAAMIDDPWYLERLLDTDDVHRTDDARGATGTRGAFDSDDQSAPRTRSWVDVVNGETGETPLMAAMRSDRHPQFRALLDAGADPDADQNPYPDLADNFTDLPGADLEAVDEGEGLLG